MPITLKLGHRSKGSVSASSPSASSPGPSAGAGGAAGPSRSVSFSQQASYAPAPPPLRDESQELPALQSSSLAMTSSSTGPPRNGAGLAVTSSPTLRAPPRPQKKRRTRSPTPPSTAHSTCLPLPSSSSSSRKSSPSADRLVHTSSLSSESQARDALDLVIQRYARLAGYAGIQRPVIEVLRGWLDHYLEDMVQLAARCAEHSGRIRPNARDLLEGIVRARRDDAADEEEEGADEADESFDLETGEAKKKDEVRHLASAKEYECEVSRIVEWRHKVPDYEPSPRAPTGGDEGDATAPAWARDDQAKFVQTLLRHKREEDKEDDDDLSETLFLLGEKTRRQEKQSRNEIPSHLPELPALHTWRKTDSYPSNRFLASSSTIEEQGKPEEGEEAAGGGAATTNGTLSRLESRLLSSRLVQTSLSALIGRLDEAGMAAAQRKFEGYEGKEQQALTAVRTSASGPNAMPSSPINSPGTFAASSPAPASQSQDTTMRTSSPSASATATGGTGPRLSIRLRTASTSQQQQQSSSGPPTPDNAPSPLSGGTTAALASRRSVAVPPPSLSLDTQQQPFQSGHQRSLSLSLSRPGSRRGTLIGGAATPATSSAWGMPQASGVLMSPATPATAGGLAGLTGFTGGASGSLGMTTPTSAVTPAWPFFGGGTASMAGTPRGSFAFPPAETGGVGEGGEGVNNNVVVTLPPVINFKQGWYGRKRAA
ncbi:hypothetical protein BDZ90DRAFT_260850 [Jaminaea rosea]|uniref:Bromodomain associated domain-containing protein n=1 Tax=Jaminaea rosea TaxID=1569628 RepID=A0A316UPF9_9BASI|nr:hypothetical protein BDZ90DRAFT_260850 [Jaminaea rosea]PWN27186.1 hypothetical protein BDZ90DRAFT_260850 [Jaminaea rosea]